MGVGASLLVNACLGWGVVLWGNMMCFLELASRCKWFVFLWLDLNMILSMVRTFQANVFVVLPALERCEVLSDAMPSTARLELTLWRPSGGELTLWNGISSFFINISGHIVRMAFDGGQIIAPTTVLYRCRARQVQVAIYSRHFQQHAKVVIFSNGVFGRWDGATIWRAFRAFRSALFVPCKLRSKSDSSKPMI